MIRACGPTLTRGSPLTGLVVGCNGCLFSATTLVRIPIEASLDLHSFDPRDIKSLVEEYVNEAHAKGLREVRLIHGRGKGVQRGIVQQALEHHPLVEEFWDATETHLGATVAKLRGAVGSGSGP